ncbi:MAG: hypothetical protein A2487_06325 [Candidatus Raymondbacteria bacterium RifOxyC12_full_50_8]|uniref:DUF1538 domain-containing protein n=1 Tax=Candidatus Raymondbacteria bacterium RIFOXYD12_FULL_49_13 TaxID=1817890 RepID=A0A1F7FC44_UNCRA|nr:MAG: hypothetical protein A2248_03225 [Candidatus Raymondbacteria bacterium RIFOXYA2_FULL_49_16]OGJ93290.1 MAG: hypothetical protein A2350_14570 [Candidatus Raymondbacteria bacterium RifOxyB12_full_50_8]OGK04250.1 MAG: hypothetical protein A2519_17980 [Candidatus Raymondbacteria bacterium RIFOXYD12_FULL_49_13]OGK06063.1 MAG: hypothetical protein A2487_06325 [Candidatus Raymondbacteria bacterium RifOxyC12_full_50_8]OGP42467.1 MAG: hypothetical protein A2324_17260 [Candidatus Raymondbacteria b
MAVQQQSSGKIKVSFKQAMGLLVPYVKDRLMAQVKSLWLIVLYLIFFQTIILGIPIAEASAIAAGLALVILGLMFYMEGLFLGIMPLGETIGVKLPQKSKLPVILLFSFILGVGVTMAEPAIGILKAAGSFVTPWDAPLLFLILNKYSSYLVYSVGVGVGCAVMFGMLRFMYNWSLKPFLFIGMAILIPASLYGLFEPNILYLSGVAWDCGAVTTGPVTVPLVLALGIGICRVVGRADSGASGFGVVSLASLFPILTVLILGYANLGSVPKVMEESDFFTAANREKAAALFTSVDDMNGYVLLNTGEATQLALFDNDKQKMLDYCAKVKADPALQTLIFGILPHAMEKWAATRGSAEQRLIVFGSEEKVREAIARYATVAQEPLFIGEILKRNTLAAIQAIMPLVIFLVLVLTLLLREKLPKADEIFLGILVALVGMTFFNIGIELGLAKLGNQAGQMLPSSFQAIPLQNEKKVIAQFDTSLVQNAVTSTGEKAQFFYAKRGEEYSPFPFHRESYDPATGQYVYVPTKGPLFNGMGGMLGILVVLAFAFIMGYGATLAEPALNALGQTVEELTVGTIKKFVIMQTVAVGVGMGLLMGLVKIIWDIPLMYLLVPPYIVVVTLTIFSKEDFTNISWDSGGVTTGPVTVPLVIAMGLGIGNQVGVVEGFGILALASVYPILTMLAVGIFLNRKSAAALKESAIETGKGGAL